MKKSRFLLTVLSLLLLSAGCAEAETQTSSESSTGDTTAVTAETEEISIIESTEFGVPDQGLLKKAAAGQTIPYGDGVIVLEDNDFVTVEVIKDYDPTAKGATLLCGITAQTWSGPAEGELVISCVYDGEWIPVYVDEIPFADYPFLNSKTPDMDEQSFVPLILSHSSSSRFVYGGSYSGSYSYNTNGQTVTLNEEEISDVVMNDWVLFDNGQHAYCSGSFVCTKEVSVFTVNWKLLMDYDAESDSWDYEKITYTAEEKDINLPPMWTGTYNGGKMGVDLILQEEFDDGTSEWLFSFYPLPGGEGESGSYTVKGTIHPGKSQVQLMDDEWVVRPKGYNMLYVAGTFDPETNHISTTMYQMELDAVFTIPEKTEDPAVSPDPVEMTLPGYMTEAICAYYDLIDAGEITQEMLDSVTSVRLALARLEYIGDNPDSEEFVEEDHVYHIYAAINGSPFGCFGPYIRPNRYENLYMAKLESNSFYKSKVDRFFGLKDVNDASLTQDGLDIMMEKFPLLEEFDAFYICDPDIKPRELREVMTAITDYVYEGDGRLISDRTLDLSSLSQLKNLTSVEYFIDTEAASSYESMADYLSTNGLSFENCPVEIIEVQGDLTDVN